LWFFPLRDNSLDTQFFDEIATALLTHAACGIAHPVGRVRLLTPGGWRDLSVVAIFSDYSSTQGSLRMSLDAYRALWGAPAVTGIALYLSPDADVTQVTRQVRARLAAFPTVEVRSSVALRERAL